MMNEHELEAHEESQKTERCKANPYASIISILVQGVIWVATLTLLAQCVCDGCIYPVG